MKLEKIKKGLKRIMANRSEVMFAYLYGSVLSSEDPRDIDIAVYLFPLDYERHSLNGEVSLSFAIPLEMDLEKRLLRKADVQVLNRAPLSFRYRVVTDGMLIVDKDSDTRCEFEYLSRVEYYDFSPRRKEYLREVIT